mmetsp:Transcript_3349/g.7867  ORF Transcript_3349/g.7867 Transcript_3349/m.7867 type:complete len:243 (+) Transcript_3349:495-1223(+)
MRSWRDLARGGMPSRGAARGKRRICLISCATPTAPTTRSARPVYGHSLVILDLLLAALLHLLLLLDFFIFWTVKVFESVLANTEVVLERAPATRTACAGLLFRARFEHGQERLLRRGLDGLRLRVLQNVLHEVTVLMRLNRVEERDHAVSGNLAQVALKAKVGKLGPHKAPLADGFLLEAELSKVAQLDATLCNILQLFGLALGQNGDTRLAAGVRVLVLSGNQGLESRREKRGFLRVDRAG